MNRQAPIYTEVTECQDCYKCIRHCPVKAIRVESGHAVIIPDNCCLCGKCVHVCPVGAKKIRDDSFRVQQLLASDCKVAAAIAPSLLAMEAAHSLPPLLTLLSALGFSSWTPVSDGAKSVNDMVRTFLQHPERREHGAIVASTACSSANRYLQIYGPSEIQRLEFPSPMIAACQSLKGLADKVVFIGPCAAKKWEADAFSETVEAALTIDELMSLAARTGVNEQHLQAGRDGRRYAYEFLEMQEEQNYPKPGGMIQSLRAGHSERYFSIAMAGIDEFQNYLEDFRQGANKQNANVPMTSSDERGKWPVLLEPLACKGGCLEGHCSTSKTSQFRSSLKLQQRIQLQRPVCSEDQQNIPLIRGRYASHSHGAFQWPQLHRQENESMVKTEEIDSFLKSIGKHKPEDEIDCGACGYDSCRSFALAAVKGYGEGNMCVSNLRKAAERKANAMMRSMPSPMIICDAELRIIECNSSFIREFLPQAEGIIDEQNLSALRQVSLESIVGHTSPFASVLTNGVRSKKLMVRREKSVYETTVFPIEKDRFVGCLLQDITQPYMQREAIIQSARTVLERNVQTVQQIAFLLGENAADSEEMLRRIIESFGAGET